MILRRRLRLQRVEKAAQAALHFRRWGIGQGAGQGDFDSRTHRRQRSTGRGAVTALISLYLCYPRGVNGYKLSFAINWSSTTISGDAMDPWVIGDYAQVLSQVVGVPVENLYFPPRLVMSWLYDPEGNVVYWKLGEAHPFAAPSQSAAGPT
jgi:hypothetical protein